MILAGCAPAHQRPPSPAHAEALADFESLRAEIDRRLFQRHRVPGPNLSYEPQTVEVQGLRVTAHPALAEEQPWNLWPDGTARLFNDTVGYLWVLDIEASAPVRWDPGRTRLAVNDTEQVFPPASGPDELLTHLLTGARWEVALGAAGELNLRARAADGFRQLYLGSAPIAGHQEAIVVFPAPTERIHAVAMQLTVAFEDGRSFEYLFE